MVKNRVKLDHVLFEIKSYGRHLRVAVIDPVTGMETYATGPSHMGQEYLKNVAKRKLEYLISKKLEERLKNR